MLYHSAMNIKPRRFLARHPKLPKILLGLVLALVIFRIFLPVICKRYINNYLENDLEAYVGSIQDFDLTLYRGAYQMQGLELRKRDNQKDPFVKIKEIDLAVAWRGLFQGKILVDVGLNKPEIFLVDSKSKEKKQLGTEENADEWISLGKFLIPFHIESLRIREGAAFFQNADLKVPYRYQFNRMQVDILNVGNLYRSAEKLPSILAASGFFNDDAPLSVDGRFNLMNAKPDFDIKAQLKGFKLPSVNSLFLTYVPVTFTRGTMGGVAELKAHQGQLDGYVKPHFIDVDVITQEHIKSLKHLGLEFVSAAGNLVLQNSKDKSVLTKFDIGGTLSSPSFSAPEWFSVAWKNAWGKPEPKGFE